MVEPEFHTSSETKASVVSHHDTLTHCFYFELCLMRHRFMSWMRLWWSSLQSTPSSKQDPMLQSPEQWCDYSISRLKFVFWKMKKLDFIVPTNSTILWSFEYTQRTLYSEGCDYRLKLKRKSVMNRPLTPAALSSFPCLDLLKQQKIIHFFFHMAAPYK